MKHLKNKIKNSKTWIFSWFISISFHLFFLWILFYQVIPLINLKDTFKFKSHPKQKYFLVDLSDYEKKNEINKEKKVISLYNYKGWGRLHKKNQEQHVLGRFNPQANNISHTLTTKTSYKKKTTAENSILVEKKGTKKINSPQKANPHTSNLAIVTKNSYKVSFWYDENNQLQIATSKKDNSEFLNELASILKNRFSLYINSGGGINYHLLNSDKVQSLALIDKNGIISFQKLIIPSADQPFLNHMAKGILENNPRLKKKPLLLKYNNKVGEIYFYLTFRFTKVPIKGWWMNLDFLQ